MDIEISCCMIVKNEEAVLARCLDSIKNIVDELIIVDTGSTDTTKKIANQYTDKVYDYQWEDDFSKARNFAFDQATKDYLFWIDADDVIDESNRQAFIDLKHTMDETIDILMIRYQIDKNYIYYRERLLKREQGYRWENPVHEVITLKGNIQYSDITIHHKKIRVEDRKRNLKIYEKKLSEGYQLNTRELFYYARELYFNQYDEQAIRSFQEFITMEDAWIENKIEACLNMADCYRHLGKKDESYHSLVNSFKYDLPRAEILCELGYYFLNQEAYQQAIYWYEQALLLTPNFYSGAFIRKDCYDFLPAIQLCICYNAINDRKRAVWYNELAGRFKPNNELVIANRQYFFEHPESQI